jgi:UDP-N-acetylglucosamine--N-acetylmuramyl-(pentapeptide) pyrophosphoryl-undecaprenol N-acetylglucosamine transferase
VKVVFAGGGTGGHVYPGLAVAAALEEQLRASGEELELLYIGVRGRVDERIVPARGIQFRAIAAGPLRVSSPITFASNLLKLGRGVVEAWTALRRFAPRAVFATGGYASVPVGVAARLRRIPLVVFLPDVTPGWAVRLLSRLATRMTTTSEGALRYLPRIKTTVVGYPVRPEFSSLDKVASRERLGLQPGDKVLLVMSGSLGARSINDAVLQHLRELVAVADVLHITGVNDVSRAIDARHALSPEEQARYHVYPYLDEMAEAMIAADLVVSRAGASILGELPAAGVPAVLIPGEYEGWSQTPNAEYLQARGAAVRLRDEELSTLATTVLDLFADDARLPRMAEAMARLARPKAAGDLARILREEAAA